MFAKNSQKYMKKCVFGKVKKDSDDEEERALFVVKFKGRCNKCGKFGHKAKDCRSNIDNDKEKKTEEKVYRKMFSLWKSGT